MQNKRETIKKNVMVENIVEAMNGAATSANPSTESPLIRIALTNKKKTNNAIMGVSIEGAI